MRGLVLFFLSLLVMPALAGLSLLPPSTSVLVLIMALIAFLALLYPFAAFDAARVARPHRAAYVLRDYNRVPVYVIFACIGLLYPALSAIVLRGNFLEAYKVATDSMAPTLRGDALSGGDSADSHDGFR